MTDDGEGPVGWIQGLCSASATVASFAIAFFGFWAFNVRASNWQLSHLWACGPLVFGVLALLTVPLWATSGSKANLTALRRARLAFMLGALSVAVGIVTAAAVV